jgi:hypothetical protein
MDWLDKHNLRHWLAGESEHYGTRTTLGEPRLEGGTPWSIPPLYVPREVRDSPEDVLEFRVRRPGGDPLHERL